MKTKRRLLYGAAVFIASLVLGLALPAQGNPYSITLANPITATGVGTSAAVPLTVNGIKMSWSGATVQLIGTSLTTVTFGVQVSTDGTNYFAWPLCTTAATPVCAATQTTTSNALFTVSTPGMVGIKYVFSGTFTATSVALTTSLTPNAIASATGAAAGGGLATQVTTNTTFANATTPQQPGIVQTINEPYAPGYGVVKIRPSVYNQTMVLQGASECQGVGATVYANSWAGLLGTALAAKGYNVINSSINGNTTAQLIARFYTDVAPFKPDIVVFCPLTVNDSYNIVTWRTNIIQLAKMARQIGAVPVVLQPSADTNYTLQQFQNVKDVAKLFAKMSIPMIDALSGTADPATGHYLAGLSGDGLHPNDAGHAVIYNSVPLTLFDQLIYDKQFGNLSSGNTRSWALSGTPTGVQASIAMDRAMTSWTWVGWVFVPTSPVLSIYASVQGTGEASDGNLRFRQNTNLTLSVSSSTTNPMFNTGVVTANAWNHLAVVYNSTLNSYTVYIAGAQSGTATSAVSGTTVSTVAFFNDIQNALFAPTGASLGTVYLYRVPLFAEQITELMNGVVHTGGLEWGSNFDTLASSSVAVNPQPPNVANTSNALTVASPVWNSH